MLYFGRCIRLCSARAHEPSPLKSHGHGTHILYVCGMCATRSVLRRIRTFTRSDAAFRTREHTSNPHIMRNVTCVPHGGPERSGPLRHASTLPSSDMPKSSTTNARRDVQTPDPIPVACPPLDLHPYNTTWPRTRSPCGPADSHTRAARAAASGPLLASLLPFQAPNVLTCLI